MSIYRQLVMPYLAATSAATVTHLSLNHLVAKVTQSFMCIYHMLVTKINIVFVSNSAFPHFNPPPPPN